MKTKTHRNEYIITLKKDTSGPWHVTKYQKTIYMYVMKRILFHTGTIIHCNQYFFKKIYSETCNKHQTIISYVINNNRVVQHQYSYILFLLLDHQVSNKPQIFLWNNTTSLTSSYIRVYVILANLAQNRVGTCTWGRLIHAYIRYALP